MEEKKKKRGIKAEDIFKQKYIRALADYQNLEKRIAEEKQSVFKRATRDLIVRLLPTLDNLDQAEIFVKDEGLKMIKNQLYKTLQEEGLKELEILGEEFNPATAEAVDVVAGDKDNMVVGIIRKGYKLNDAIIRVAQVKVSKKV